MTARHTLVLMRHAKSDYPGGTTDHDRPLSPRGLREASLAGRWLVEHDLEPDEILCSSAARAQQTAMATGIAAPVRVADQVYDASPAEILDQVSVTAEAISTLLVVGHAPGIPALAVQLAGELSAPESVAEVHRAFATSALAVLEFQTSWSRLAVDAARLVGVHTARA